MNIIKLLALILTVFFSSNIIGQKSIEESLKSKDWITYYPKTDSINVEYRDFDLILIPHRGLAKDDDLMYKGSFESRIADWKPREFLKSQDFTDWNVLFFGGMKPLPITGKWSIHSDTYLQIEILNTGGDYSEQYKKGEMLYYQVQKLNDSLIVANKYNYSKSRNISEINFKTSGCEGTCPVFELNLKRPNKKSELLATEYNQQLKGEYEVIIDTHAFFELEKLIYEANLLNIYTKFETDSTCEESYLLEIVYSDNSKRLVDDYGGIANNNKIVKKIYNLLFNMRFSQKWNKKE